MESVWRRGGVNIRGRARGVCEKEGGRESDEGVRLGQGTKREEVG